MISRSAISTNLQRQKGGALIVALFLIVVVAALGTFAIRIGANEQQTANLTLLEARVSAAAYSGLEYGSYLAQVDACATGGVALPGPPPGMRNITVTLLRCQRSVTSAGNVYDLTARAFSGTYGNPDFVQRIFTRRVTNIAPGSW